MATNCIFYLAIASVLCFCPSTFAANAATMDAFNTFLGNSQTDYKREVAYGVGPEFASTLMHEARFKFALLPGNEQYASLISFTSLQKDQITCRVDGYLDYCAHPFGGNTSNVDIDPPYHADFVVYDEPFFTPNSNDVQNFPLFVLGVSAVFNIPGVNRLVLDKPTLSKIFRGCTGGPSCLPGSILTWGDPAIKATNDPSVYAALDAAGPIKVIVQSDSGSSTAAMKRALASFDEDFAAQIGATADPSPTWNGTNHIRYPGAHGVLYGVKSTPGSISYVKISMVEEQPGVRNVELLTGVGSNKTVFPNSDALFAAVQEIGLAFGNDGTDPSRLTVDLTGALGMRSWPIVSIGYLALRTNSTTNEANCMQKKTALIKFLEFLYSNNGAGANKLYDNGFGPLTVDGAHTVLDLIRARLFCDGQLVYNYPPPAPLVTIQADESLHNMLQILGSVFQETWASQLVLQPLQSHLQIRHNYVCLGNASCTDIHGGFVVLADENLSTYIIRDALQDSTYKLFSMPYCAMATGLIHNFCAPDDTNCPYLYSTPLVLDLETAARILDTDITYWNDTAIKRLNPDKVLPPFPIHVVAGPKTSRFHFEFINVVRSSYVPDFSYSGGGIGKLTYLEAWLEVSLIPYSISFVPFNGTVVEGVSTVSLISRGGKVVPPEIPYIEACAKDTYDPAANVFFVSASQNPDCYPLVQVYNILMRNKIKFSTAGWLTNYLYQRAVRNENGDATVLTVSNLGTLVDLQLTTVDMKQRNFEELESVTLLDGTSVIRVPHDLTLIPSSLVIVMYAILTLELMFFFGLAAWVVIHRNRKLVRNSSPLFMIQVLVGAAIMACTVIPLAQQDDYLVPRGMTEEQLAVQSDYLNRACVAEPVLFSLGFFILFSALFLKSWRLIRIFNNKKLKNLFLRDRQLLLYQLAVMVIVIVLNLVWAVRDPLIWKRFPTFINNNGLVVASYGICYSQTGVYPALPLLIGVMLVLIIGNYLSYLGRRIPTEFNESKWTAMAMVMTLEAFTIGLPILILANSQPVPGFIIKSLSSLLVPGATVCLIFVPKVAMAYGWGLIEGESNPWRFVKEGDSGSGKPKNNSTKDGAHAIAIAGESGSNSKTSNSRIKVVQPSLNSLVEGKVTAVSLITDNKVAGHSSMNPFFHVSKTKDIPSSSPKQSPKRISKDFQGSTTSEALTKVLQDDPMRRRFRRYLQTLKMEENVRFWDSVLIFRMEPDEHRRYVSARAIIQTFVLDSSPLQVNLSSKTKSEIVKAFHANDKTVLGSPEFFNPATNELFEDLRQSDAFRKFLENDTFSQQDVLNNSKSDPTIVPVDSSISSAAVPNNTAQMQ